jgi:hypothetical protein
MGMLPRKSTIQVPEPLRVGDGVIVVTGPGIIQQIGHIVVSSVRLEPC